jgi:transcriptional regulator with XRE-family HTH domain
LQSSQNAKFGGAKMREWLKKMREQKCLTMKTVAVAAGISECYYSQIEGGTRNCPVNTAKKIAEVLGFDWQKFFE